MRLLIVNRQDSIAGVAIRPTQTPDRSSRHNHARARFGSNRKRSGSTILMSPNATGAFDPASEWHRVCNCGGRHNQARALESLSAFRYGADTCRAGGRQSQPDRSCLSRDGLSSGHVSAIEQQAKVPERPGWTHGRLSSNRPVMPAVRHTWLSAWKATATASQVHDTL